MRTCPGKDNDMEVTWPTKDHKLTIIFLHGCGSNAAEFMAELFESQASDGRTLREIFPQAKWVFPNAGMLYSATFGVEMSQWYDLRSTQNPRGMSDEQQAALEKSVRGILDILREEAAIVDSRNIFLAGISQGCATAIYTLLCQDNELGGFIGLSSWLLKSANLLKTSAEARGTPVFLAHCEDDAVINLKYGEELAQEMRNTGFKVEWHKYVDGGHWINEPKGIGK
jgi:predicted esterase